jgi:hypothetical protein
VRRDVIKYFVFVSCCVCRMPVFLFHFFIHILRNKLTKNCESGEKNPERKNILYPLSH